MVVERTSNYLNTGKDTSDEAKEAVNVLRQALTNGRIGALVGSTITPVGGGNGSPPAVLSILTLIRSLIFAEKVSLAYQLIRAT